MPPEPTVSPTSQNSPAATSPQDELDSIREEIRALGTQIARFALLSLVFLFLFWSAVTRAHRSLINETVREQVHRHAELTLITDSGALPSPYELLEDEILDGMHPLSSDEEASKDAARVDSARTEQAALEDSLEITVARAKQQLTMDYTVAGLKIPLNLVEIALFLPLAFIASLMYLVILRTKKRILLEQGRAVVRAANGVTVLQRDRLMFSHAGSSPPPFSAHPEQLLTCVYLITVALILFDLIMMIGIPVGAALRSLTEVYSVTSLLLFMLPFAALLAYVVYFSWIYTWNVQRTIEGEARRLLGTPPLRPPLELITGLVDRGFAKLRMRWLARTSVTSGSTLVLLTLGLPIATTVASCSGDSEPRRGWQFALGKDDAIWPAAQWIFSVDFLHSSLARIMYVVMLIVASCGLLYVILGLVLHPTRLRTMAVLLFWPSTAALLFLLGESSIDPPILVRHEVPRVRTFLWVPVFAVWFAAASYRANTRSIRWGAIRRLFIVISIPVIGYMFLNLLLSLLYTHNSVSIYIVGVGLLTLGLYLDLTTPSYVVGHPAETPLPVPIPRRMRFRHPEGTLKSWIRRATD